MGRLALRLGHELPDLAVHQSVSTFIIEYSWLCTKYRLPKSHGIDSPSWWIILEIHVCFGQQLNRGIVLLTIFLKVVDPLFYISCVILDCDFVYEAVPLPWLAIVDPPDLVSEWNLDLALDHDSYIESDRGMMIAWTIDSVGDPWEQQR